MGLEQLKFTTDTEYMQIEGPTRLKFKLQQHYGLTSPELPKKGVVWMEKKNNPANSLWDVRVSLDGYACVIGCVRGDFSVTEKVLRFADMTRLYFWKYRVRGKDQPDDEDFNFSKRQAELDLKNETAIVAFLDRQAEYLKSISVLKFPEQREKRSRPTDQLNSRMGSLQLKFIEQEKKLDAQDKKLDELARRLSGLESTLHQLHDVTAVIMDQQKREVDAIDGVRQFNGQLVSTLSDLTGKFQQLAYAMHEFRARLNGADEEIVSPRDNPNLVSSGGTSVLPSAT